LRQRWSGTEYPFADERVAAHELPLFIVERARFVQDLIGNSGLSDVVKRGGLKKLAGYFGMVRVTLEQRGSERDREPGRA
jgi:hypothetical protein